MVTGDYVMGNSIKNGIRKALVLAGIMQDHKVIIKSEKWIKKESQKYEGTVKRLLDIQVESEIPERKPYQRQTMEIECAIDNLLSGEKSNFSDMIVLKNPYQYAPLCALAIFNTKKEYSVHVTVFGKTKDCNISYDIPKTAKHKVPIMGLYPDWNNSIEIKLMDSNNKVKKVKRFELYIPALKGNIAQLKIDRLYSEKKYLYDLTLVYGGDDGICPFAYDRNGDIRFCFGLVPKTYGFQPISQGKFLYLSKKVTRHTCTNPAAIQMYEVDQMGRILKCYNVEKGAHHDFAELEDGNIVTAGNSIEGRTFEDTVIEIDRNTGNIVNEIRIKDYIDKQYVDSADWAHLNTLQYDKKKKTVMICLRNLHSVLKINYEAGQLEWILGNPEFWKGSTVEDKVLKPKGEIKWFFQAHSAYFIDTESDIDGNKRLIIYDNHTCKRRPVKYFDKSNHSYIKIYKINEDKKIVFMERNMECDKSNIRSNAVLEKEAGRLFAMNGKVSGTNKAGKGSVEEYDYKSGKLLNKYVFNFGFYRAYGLKLEPVAMSKSSKIDSNYTLGTVQGLQICERPDMSKAILLPDIILEQQDKNEEERKKRLSKLAKSNPELIDKKQDLARVQLQLEEDILYVTMIDHLLERIYLVGKKNTYYRDYTNTKQERPEYFARAIVTEPISLRKMKADEYVIYYQFDSELYQSNNKVRIKK